MGVLYTVQLMNPAKWQQSIAARVPWRRGFQRKTESFMLVATNTTADENGCHVAPNPSAPLKINSVRSLMRELNGRLRFLAAFGRCRNDKAEPTPIGISIHQRLLVGFIPGGGEHRSASRRQRSGRPETDRWS